MHIQAKVMVEIHFDEEDYPLVADYRWHVIKADNSLMYAVTYATDPDSGSRLLIYMHHLILGQKDGFLPDHKDGNGLNNRRSNLRFATPGQNCANSRPRKGSSRFKGVCFKKGRISRPWQAEIMKNYTKRHLGMFETEEEAAVAYDQAALEQWGEFARLNLPAVHR
jgi:hypothetical protein